MPIDCKIANTFDTFPFAMPRQEKREMGKESGNGNGNGIGNGNENRHHSVSVCVCVCGQCQFAIGRWHWANLCLVCLQANAK